MSKSSVIIGALSNRDIKVEITSLNAQKINNGLNDTEAERLNQLRLEQKRRTPKWD